jgi:fructose-bisphosphate aldolase class II
MPLVTLKEILKDPHEKHYGIPAINVFNLEMTRAVIQAAELEKSPVIVALAEIHSLDRGLLADIADLIVSAARRAKVSVCAHFDHGYTRENCIRVMHHGFKSIMFDGSDLPYKENVKKTAEMVHFASLFGASVEGELGHVGMAEGGREDKTGMIYTNPDETQDFFVKTGIDALAVSFGTAHGSYKTKPHLDLERLRAIRAKCPIPLVMHGGSGLSEQDFLDCIRSGISKINIATEFIATAMNAISRRQDCGDFYKLLELSTATMREYVCEKMRLFGSSGKA